MPLGFVLFRSIFCLAIFWHSTVTVAYAGDPIAGLSWITKSEKARIARAFTLEVAG